MNIFDPKKKQIELKNPNEILITIDIDWAPDPVIEFCIDLLNKLNLKATFFATHTNSLISNIESSNNFEIGIHPNFFNCNDYSKHLDEMKNLFPNAKSVRSHGLFSSSNIFDLYRKKGFEISSDIFIPYGTNIKPFWRNSNGSLLVIPYFWEDGNYIGDEKFNIPDFSRLEHTEGIKIFNFHPIHLFTNADSINFYNDKVKNIYHDVDNLIKIKKSYGIRNFLEELSLAINSFQYETRTLFEFSRSAFKVMNNE